MKRCRHYYLVRTEKVTVPAHLQRDTRLPGNPQGHDHLGFALFRRELLLTAMLDREAGGQPSIEKVSADESRPRGEAVPQERELHMSG
jgi:hypothetical protein